MDISGSLIHTGSIDIVGDLTIQGDVTANVGNFDTVNARLLNITEESASVIFSSGSNVLGDDETDRQDLIGQVIVSGTLGVEGNSAFTGSLTVSNEISSSTINGIGNVTSYSASVDSTIIDVDTRFQNFTSSYLVDSASFDNRIDQLESDTGSQDSRLDSLEEFTGSQETINGFYNQHTESLNAFTSSQFTINSGYNSFTQSTDTEQTQQNNRLNSLEVFTGSLVTDFVGTATFNSYTSSTDNRLDTLEADASTYVTTGSNTFDGAQTISGSLNGNVSDLTIVSETASMDLDVANFFNLTLVSGSTTLLLPTNIKPGQTISLRVTQPAVGTGNLNINTSIKFPINKAYVPTAQSDAIDIVTFVSHDSTELYSVAVNQLTV